MYPMFPSSNIQNRFLKFPEFITLQHLVHKVCGHGFSRQIIDRQISLFTWSVREKYLMFKCLLLLLELF